MHTPYFTWVSLPVLASHTLSERSAEPVATYWESAEKVTHTMGSLCDIL